MSRQLMDPIVFTDILADILRLPDETLAMAYIYRNKYARAKAQSAGPDPLDAYTLTLTTLSLASKSTSTPRPPHILLPAAHALLHPTSPPLSPSPPSSSSPSSSSSPPAYASLAHTLRAAETYLLLTLAFATHAASPLDFIPRYVARATRALALAPERFGAWSADERAESGVVGDGGARVERGCVGVGGEACKSYPLVNFFPARTVAAACVYSELRRRAYPGLEARARWLDYVTGGKVDVGDFEEALGELGKI